MKSVVDHGTGTKAQIPGVLVAGKTGTAENAPGQAPYAWFIGFAPPNGKRSRWRCSSSTAETRRETTGGEAAAPIAKDVMQAVMEVSDPRQDTLLGDRYRPDPRIAIGGMGEVWRADDDRARAEVAVKVIKSEYAGSDFRERFRPRPARPGCTIRRGHRLRLRRAGGRRLPGDGAGRRRAAGGALAGRGACRRATGADRGQAAEALAGHTSGIVHRDVKPANLLVPRRRPKITDFGIARAADAGR